MRTTIRPLGQTDLEPLRRGKDIRRHAETRALVLKLACRGKAVTGQGGGLGFGYRPWCKMRAVT